MIEKHLYESNLNFGNIKYDLSKLQSTFLNYLEENTKPVFSWNPKSAYGDLNGFHSNGISIHLQSTSTKDSHEYNNIDIKLISEVTPTIKLEKRLEELSQKHIEIKKISLATGQTPGLLL